MTPTDNLIVLWLALSCLVLAPCAVRADQAGDADAVAFLRRYEDQVRPVEIALSQAWWEANTTGSDEAFAAKERLQNRLDELLASTEQFTQLKQIKSTPIEDPLIRRQIDVLYLIYLGKQVDLDLLQRISALENVIDKQFNQFRASVDGKTLTDSEVRKRLLDSNDSVERQQVWEASKAVGEEVAGDLRQLVQLRNKGARALGFDDFHVMQLALSEQDPQQVLALFDELDALTRDPFLQVKGEMDDVLATRYGIGVEALLPWHYQDPFFQEAPSIYDVDFDSPFRHADILRVCKEFYQGIGLPIDDVLARSDLYEKPKKSPHAFCTDVDREGDVRVLANIAPNAYWMSTMLHELGHAVYSSKFIPADLPYLLRCDSHILTTEGVAMMFERFSVDPAWLAAYGVKVDEPFAYAAAARRQRQAKLLIFSRWCQVMYRFEMAMYHDPSQDLNKLWWDLVAKYQMLHRPPGRNAADFASKIHVVSSPAYYHNYMMGELFACQLHAAIAQRLGLDDAPATASYTRERAVGSFMREKVFDKGKLLPWNALTEFATGAPLNAKAFAAEFQ